MLTVFYLNQFLDAPVLTDPATLLTAPGVAIEQGEGELIEALKQRETEPVHAAHRSAPDPKQTALHAPLPNALAHRHLA